MKKLKSIALILFIAVNIGGGILLARDCECGHRYFARGCKVAGSACVLTLGS